MTITSNDIRVYQAQDNTDNDSGGGSRTSNEVVDGDVNNLFPDISRIDTVSGDVALRKVFATINTDNRDIYFGAHAMIRAVPEDEKVSALLFHTDDPHDERVEAQDKIESYVTASFLEQFYLFGNQIEGSRTVTFLEQLEAQEPDVGIVYLLKEGVTEQYVRVVSVTSQEVTLSYSFGGPPVSYVRRRIVCEIDQPLTIAFTGSSFNPAGQLPNTADTFATQISDAARFYSTKKLAQPAVTGSDVIRIDSIYEQLVPASRQQTPIVNRPAVSQGALIVSTGQLVSQELNTNLTPGSILVLQDAVTPGTLTTTFGGYIDDGRGSIIDAGDVTRASIDYKTGTILVIATMVSNNTYNFQPAAIFDSQIQFTNLITITLENKGLVYVRNLSPLPTPGDLYIDYRAQGKWQRITSNADGTLGGDAQIGAGSLFDNGDGTGTVSITLGAEPDIDSSIVFSWGSADRLLDHKSNVASNTTAYLRADLGQTNIDPTSFVFAAFTSLTNSTRNITCDMNGVLSDPVGGVRGRLDFVNGILVIDQALTNGVLSNPGSNPINTIAFDYASSVPGQTGELFNETFDRVADTDVIAIDSENIPAGTLNLTIPRTVQINTVVISTYISLDGSEDVRNRRPLVLEADTSGVLRVFGRNFNDNTTYGTVAPNGNVNIQFPSDTLVTTSPTYAGSFGSSGRYNLGFRFNRLSFSGGLQITYRSVNPLAFSQSELLTDVLDNIFSYRINTVNNIIGEVSLNFTTLDSSDSSRDTRLVSRQGVMYNNVNSTGLGTAIGTIDYSTGEIQLNYFTSPRTLNAYFLKLFSDDLGDGNDNPTNIAFRTAATRLTTSSFQLRYETANGNFSAVSDGNGVVTGTDIDSVNSFVDTLTGMASIVFTSPVIPDSLFYDAVAVTTLPLDPELLGLNPVRLPSDGRVPVFSNGRHIIIFNEITTAVTGGTPTANQVETLARQGQAYIEVIDINGRRLNPDQYVADRVLGTVTFANSLVFQDKYGANLVAPYSIVDRIEDMLLATNVEINGIISLSGALTHDYPSDTTKIASTLVWGDTGARVYNIFSQELWNSGDPVWSDLRIGDGTTAQYDNLNYPIQIDNQSSTAGRWAVIFRSPTVVDVVEEFLGVVQAAVSIAVDDVAPINPATNMPYFVMPRLGFGSGWIANNVVRLNTDSGDNNMWVIRTVQSGTLTNITDNIELEIRGDAN